LTQIEATLRSFVPADETLMAFVELESAIRNGQRLASRLVRCLGTARNALSCWAEPLVNALCVRKTADLDNDVSFWCAPPRQDFYYLNAATRSRLRY
jgi:hypothetical protein